MRRGEPSRTALAAAAHRAAHQVLEQARIFRDPLAARILGGDAETFARDAAEHPERQGMRLFLAARSRLAEDALAAAVERGVEQLVVLGAGLDTFAYRNPFGDALKIFEVDHPDTQAWKRERLQTAGIAIPRWLTFAPVDFERDASTTGLAAGLSAAGFDASRPSFFTWLGVVPYLTKSAIWSTLGFIGSTPGGAHVVFDYGDAPETLPPEMRARHEARAARVAAIGEAWVSHFDREEIRAKLLELGFRDVEDLGPRDIAARFFRVPLDQIPERGGHIVRASCYIEAFAS